MINISKEVCEYINDKIDSTIKNKINRDLYWSINDKVFLRLPHHYEIFKDIRKKLRIGEIY